MSEEKQKRMINNWQAALIRVTGFPAPASFDEKRNFWSELGLGESASHERKKGEVADQGPAFGHWLVVSSSIGRVDWVHVPDPAEAEGARFQDVGPFPEAIDRFAAFLESWLGEKSPEFLRFALGATVDLPVTDRGEGYQQLSAYLPFKLDENSSDFLYQINRPRASKIVSGLNINRLTQWSVAMSTGMRGHVILNSGGLLSPSWQSHGSQHACRVVLDLNSVPEYNGKLTAMQLPELLREFVTLAKEIVAEGDIP